MNVSTWSIKNPIPALMLFVLLTFGGLLSFNAMKVQNFPDMDLPVVMVTAALPGAVLRGSVALPVMLPFDLTSRAFSTSLPSPSPTLTALRSLALAVQPALLA